MQPIFKLQNLNFIYNEGKDNEYQALANVSLEIYPEEFIILFGPSGCGKSTLLNIIANLEIPDENTVYYYDTDMSKMSTSEAVNYHRKTIGMIYQAYNLITSLTVLDNVALPQIFLDISRRERDKKSLAFLDRFGIKKQAHKLPTELSGGQQQRIGIARSIINDPEIILADEPVGNLDSVSAKNVLEILRDLNEKEKRTVIMVTHNPENLEYADRVFHLKDGVIIKETVNHDKHKILKKKKTENEDKAPTTALKDIMRAYAGLTAEQINILIMPYKAKVFAHHFITTRNMEETKIFEDVMQRRLMGTISGDEFFDILNRPFDEGGVGFDIRTAEKINERVGRVLKMARLVYQRRKQSKNAEGVHEIMPEEEKAQHFTKYLLHSCFTDYKRNIVEIKVNRLERAVRDRLAGKVNKNEFFNILDAPFKDGGVGLNSKTARTVTEEFEMILILGFGVQAIAKGKKTKKEVNEEIKKEIPELAMVAHNKNKIEKGEMDKENIDEITKIINENE